MIMTAVYLFMSIVTFCVYGLDKFKARRGMWRIQEKTLHILEFCCGRPGAMLAHKYLRHKSYKPSFRRMFWCSSIANVIVVALVITLV